MQHGRIRGTRYKLLKKKFWAVRRGNKGKKKKIKKSNTGINCPEK